jgi:hypothetical protein
VNLTRRTAIRRAMLLASGVIMGQMTAAKAEAALLTVDLGLWAAVQFKFHGKTTTIPVAEIFEALKGTE